MFLLNRSYSRIALSAITALGLTTAACAQIASVGFTNIADGTSPEFADIFFATDYSINNAGVVAFSVRREVSGFGIYKAIDDTAFSAVAQTGAFFGSGFGAPHINDSGLVSFTAALASGGSGVFTASDTSSFTTILTNPNPINFGFFGDTRINNSGTVAFQAVLSGQSFRGLYKTNGVGGFTEIANNSEATFLPVPRGIGFNNNGVAAFTQERFFGRETSRGGGGAITPVANVNSLEFTNLVDASLNDSGLVVFQASRDSGGKGIYTAQSIGSFSTIVTTLTDPEINEFFDAPSINNNGAIAFAANRANSLGGGMGIYLALSGFAPQRILRTGDTLFGSTVTSLSLSPESLNDQNQVAFSYILANGVSGIARANASVAAAAPEPASLSLLGMSFAGLAGAKAMRRRRAR